MNLVMPVFLTLKIYSISAAVVSDMDKTSIIPNNDVGIQVIVSTKVTQSNQSAIFNRKSISRYFTPVAFRRGERTGRRPWASKRGGHVKSEITEMKML